VPAENFQEKASATRNLSLRQRRWLESELSHWEAQGLISSEQRSEILNLYPEVAQQRRWRQILLQLLAAVATLFLGLAVYLVVLFNWDVISPAAKIAIVTIVLALAQIAVGIMLRKLPSRLWTEVGLTAVTVLFGIAIFQAGQALQVTAPWRGLFLWWVLGIAWPVAAYPNFFSALAYPVLLFGWALGGTLVPWWVSGPAYSAGFNSQYIWAIVLLLWGFGLAARGRSTIAAVFCCLVLFLWVHEVAAEVLNVRGEVLVPWAVFWGSLLWLGGELLSWKNQLGRAFWWCGVVLLCIALGFYSAETISASKAFTVYSHVDLAAARVFWLVASCSVLVLGLLGVRLTVNLRSGQWLTGAGGRRVVRRLSGPAVFLLLATFFAGLEAFRAAWIPAARLGIGPDGAAWIIREMPTEWVEEGGVILSNGAMLGLSLWLMWRGFKEATPPLFAAGTVYLFVWAIWRYADLFGLDMLAAAGFFAIAGVALFALVRWWGWISQRITREGADAELSLEEAILEGSGLKGRVFSWFEQRKSLCLGVGFAVQIAILASVIVLRVWPFWVAEPLTVSLRVSNGWSPGGRYLSLRYDISELDVTDLVQEKLASSSPGRQPGPSSPEERGTLREDRVSEMLRGRTLFLPLEELPGGQQYRLGRPVLEKPEPGPFLKGRILSCLYVYHRAGSPSVVAFLAFGIESIFVPEGSAPIWQDKIGSEKVWAKVLIAADGSAWVAELQEVNSGSPLTPFVSSPDLPPRPRLPGPMND